MKNILLKSILILIIFNLIAICLGIGLALGNILPIKYAFSLFGLIIGIESIYFIFLYIFILVGLKDKEENND